jgi:hypothetical protein
MAPSTLLANDAAQLNPTDSSSHGSSIYASGYASEEELPPIEVRTFPLKIVDRSTSNRIYLMEATSNDPPKVGQIFLSSREEGPVMAFRVVKTYSDHKLFAAKQIKKYAQLEFLEKGDHFLGIEKTADKLTLPAAALAMQASDKSDLKELESKEDLRILPIDPLLDESSEPALTPEPTPTLSSFAPPTPIPTPVSNSGPVPPTAAFDQELDAGTSPTDSEKPSKGDEAEVKPTNSPPDPDLSQDSDDPDSSLATIDDIDPIDLYRHWLTAGVGYVRNTGPTGASYYFSAGNIRYGLTVGQMVFVKRKSVQDAFILEGGAYFYKSLNYLVQGDAYTILAGSAALRYHLTFGPNFGIFVSAGVMQNNVIASSQSSPAGLAALSNLSPTIGTGLLFQIGPSWYTRLDVGYDSVGVNLLLRF